MIILPNVIDMKIKAMSSYFLLADDKSCAVAGEVYDPSNGVCKCGTANSCTSPGTWYK